MVSYLVICSNVWNIFLYSVKDTKIVFLLNVGLTTVVSGPVTVVLRILELLHCEVLFVALWVGSLWMFEALYNTTIQH